MATRENAIGRRRRRYASSRTRWGLCAPVPGDQKHAPTPESYSRFGAGTSSTFPGRRRGGRRILLRSFRARTSNRLGLLGGAPFPIRRSETGIWEPHPPPPARGNLEHAELARQHNQQNAPRPLFALALKKSFRPPRGQGLNRTGKPDHAAVADNESACRPSVCNRFAACMPTLVYTMVGSPQSSITQHRVYGRASAGEFTLPIDPLLTEGAPPSTCRWRRRSRPHLPGAARGSRSFWR